MDKLTKAEPANDKKLRTKLVRNDIKLPKDFEKGWHYRMCSLKRNVENGLAFVLDNVFTKKKCNEYIRTTEEMGYETALVDFGGEVSMVLVFDHARGIRADKGKKLFHEDGWHPALKDALKKICTGIYDKGGIIRNMENLGLRELPYMIKVHKKKHYQGNYFIIKFDSSVKAMNDLQVAYRKDENIVRCGVVLNEEEPRRPCLDGQQCHFGELPIPEYDKMAYKRKVYGKMKYPASEAVPNKVKIRK